MFDLDHSGTIDIHEFDKLFGYINQWLTVFKTYDRDGSGQIDESEITQGIWYLCIFNEICSIYYIYLIIIYFFLYNSFNTNGISFFSRIYKIFSCKK